VRAEGFGVKAVASGLGLGYLPMFPGTWASAAAGVMYYLLRQLPAPSWQAALGAAFGAAVVAGLLICPAAQAAFGEHDPRRFVLDEMAGVWLTCLLFWWRGPLATAVAAFLAFRILDGLKPFPIRRLEKLPGAWGVMADDLGAAVLSALALWVVCYGLLDRVVK
jgi:phosphatidylglycerophosphatase A